MTERKGSAETRELIKALLSKYPSREDAAKASEYSTSYFSYLSTGRKIAGKPFCRWVKANHPDLTTLCIAVQISRALD